jgi:hypothetical protein
MAGQPLLLMYLPQTGTGSDLVGRQEGRKEGRMERTWRTYGRKERTEGRQEYTIEKRGG